MKAKTVVISASTERIEVLGSHREQSLQSRLELGNVELLTRIATGHCFVVRADEKLPHLPNWNRAIRVCEV